MNRVEVESASSLYNVRRPLGIRHNITIQTTSKYNFTLVCNHRLSHAYRQLLLFPQFKSIKLRFIYLFPIITFTFPMYRIHVYEIMSGVTETEKALMSMSSFNFHQRLKSLFICFSMKYYY